MEIKSLNCPNCSAPLNVEPGDTAIECSHCGSDLRITSAGEAKLFFHHQSGQPDGPPGLDMDEVERLARAGRKIDAIKLVREKTGWGLKESKDFVDDIEAGKETPRKPNLPDYPRQSDKTYGPPNWDVIRAELAGGNKINAIKLYREQTGVGLKDAKDAVEMFERGQTPPPPNIPTPSSAIPGNVDMEAIRLLLSKGNKIEAVKIYRAQTGVGLKEALEVIDALPEARTVSGGATGGSSMGCMRVLLIIVGIIVLLLGGCGFVVQRGDLYQCAINDITHDREVIQALGEPVQTSPFVFVLGYESSSDFFGNSSVSYGAVTYLKGAKAGSIVQISASHETGFQYYVVGDLSPNGQKLRIFTSGDIESCTQ